MNIHVFSELFLFLFEVPHILKFMFILLSLSHFVAFIFYDVTFELQLFQVFKSWVISHAKLNIYNMWAQILRTQLRIISVNCILYHFLNLLPKFELNVNFISAIFVWSRKLIYFDCKVPNFDCILIKKIWKITLKVLKNIDKTKNEDHWDDINNDNDHRNGILIHVFSCTSQP